MGLMVSSRTVFLEWGGISMHRNGFNLIELMIVLAVLGVIAAIAVPIYTNYTYRGKQVEAKTLLMTLKVEEEQFRAENNCYTTSITNLVASNKLFTNNRIYSLAATPAGTVTITGASAGSCTTNATLPNDFQAVVTGTLASGKPTDKWGISDRIPAPVHCDGRATYTTDQTAACAGQTTTEMEY